MVSINPGASAKFLYLRFYLCHISPSKTKLQEANKLERSDKIYASTIKRYQLSLSADELFHGMSFQCCLSVAQYTNHHHTETLLAYLCPCLCHDLFMSYLYNLFFIFVLIFIAINDITSFKQTYLFFGYCFSNNFQIATVQPQGFAQLLLDFLPVSAWRCL